MISYFSPFFFFLCFRKNVAELIPKTVYPIRTIEQWIERINTKLQVIQQQNINQIDARAYFLG